MHEIDAKLSDYRPGSELNAVGAVPHKASEDLWRVVQFAQRLAETSGGAFDITLGNRTRAWREGRTATGPFGWRTLRMNEATREVWLENPQVRLDAGGIAKGYAAQQRWPPSRRMASKGRWWPSAETSSRESRLQARPVGQSESPRATSLCSCTMPR